jgi:hypothetical protein
MSNANGKRPQPAPLASFESQLRQISPVRIWQASHLGHSHSTPSTPVPMLPTPCGTFGFSRLRPHGGIMFCQGRLLPHAGPTSTNGASSGLRSTQHFPHQVPPDSRSAPAGHVCPLSLHAGTVLALSHTGYADLVPADQAPDSLSQELCARSPVEEHFTAAIA